MPGDNKTSVKWTAVEDVALAQLVRDGVKDRDGWMGVGTELQRLGFRLRNRDGDALTAREAGNQAKDRYARIMRAEAERQAEPKTGETRKWNKCNICGQIRKGHSCTGPPDDDSTATKRYRGARPKAPGISKEEVKAAFASVQTPVEGTDAEIVSFFRRVLPEAELYDGPPPTPTGAAARASAPPACPPSNSSDGVAWEDRGTQVYNGPPAAPSAGNVTWMLDPLTNTIVDAPVASPPVNEAPAAGVAADSAAAVVAATVVAAGPSALWDVLLPPDVLGQLAEQAAAVNAGAAAAVAAAEAAAEADAESSVPHTADGSAAGGGFY